MTIKTYNPLRDGLEIQLNLLKQEEYTCDDDVRVCIVCYMKEDECACPDNEKVLWPLVHAIRMLELVLEEMDN